MSTFGVAERRCPSPWRASIRRASLATCSSAFDGMQPRYRHTPPGFFSLSIERDLHAEVGGIERRGVPAGAGANDCDVMDI